jgi:hypothetical protein
MSICEYHALSGDLIKVLCSNPRFMVRADQVTESHVVNQDKYHVRSRIVRSDGNCLTRSSSEDAVEDGASLER